MTIYGYMRVSTDDQTHDLQKSALLAAGIDPKNIFHDKISGSTKARPGLEKLQAALQPGDTVTVWKLDRLGRSLGHLIHFIERLHQQDCHFHSLTEQLDTKSPMGKCMFHVCGAFAQMERELISQRTKAGMIEAVAMGRKVGRPGIPKEKRDQILTLARTPGATVAWVAKMSEVNQSTVQRTLYPEKTRLKMKRKRKKAPTPLLKRQISPETAQYV